MYSTAPPPADWPNCQLSFYFDYMNLVCMKFINFIYQSPYDENSWRFIIYSQIESFPTHLQWLFSIYIFSSTKCFLLLHSLHIWPYTVHISFSVSLIAKIPAYLFVTLAQHLYLFINLFFHLAIVSDGFVLMASQLTTMPCCSVSLDS